MNEASSTVAVYVSPPDDERPWGRIDPIALARSIGVEPYDAEGLPVFDDQGVDLSQVRASLDRTPAERLRESDEWAMLAASVRC